jgi:hypothetical protein
VHYIVINGAANVNGMNVKLGRIVRYFSTFRSTTLNTQCVTEVFFLWGGSTNSVEKRGQRERGSGDGSPLVRGSGGSGNLVQEI